MASAIRALPEDELTRRIQPFVPAARPWNNPARGTRTENQDAKLSQALGITSTTCGKSQSAP